MQIDIPNPIVQECIDSGIIQMTGSMGSVESRGNQVQRLTYHVGEYVIAKVQKVFNYTKRLK